MAGRPIWFCRIWRRPPADIRATDHLRIVALCEAAADFAAETLAPGGGFVAKVLQGGADGSLLSGLKRDFRRVRHFKPPASRSDSAEMYLVADGFRGGLGNLMRGLPGIGKADHAAPNAVEARDIVECRKVDERHRRRTEPPTALVCSEHTASALEPPSRRLWPTRR